MTDTETVKRPLVDGVQSAKAAPIPDFSTTRDKVETSIGTLEYRDGAPRDETVRKVYDHLDLMHGARMTNGSMAARAIS